MAPLRARSRNWFIPILSIALLSILPRGSSSAPGQACAYTPQAVWGQLGVDIVARLGTTPGTIYVYDPSTSWTGAGKPIPKPEEYWAYDAKASPRGDLIAFHGAFQGGIGSPGTGVGVVDRKGTIVEWIQCGEAFSWSPDGHWLAVILSKWDRRGAPTHERLALWNRRSRSKRTFDMAPSHVGWAGKDSLLLQVGAEVYVLDPGSGEQFKSGHHGTIVSSDNLYSLWPGEDGQNTKVFEEETGYDVTSRLFGPLEQRGLHQIRSAFWVRGEGSDHYMVVSGCDNVYGQRPTCTTAIVDARTGEIVVEFPGEALGPSGDGKTVILLRHGSYRMQSVNLEAMVGLLLAPGSFY